MKMNDSASIIAILIKEFEIYKTQAVEKEKKSWYEIIWTRKISDNNSIHTFSIEYGFDMDSVLVFCKDNNLDPIITENFTINGIAVCFSQIAAHALILGRENYRELAELLLKNRGTIIGGKFGN